ncbi:MAG TPA: carboxylating nicotinate-nucleotide diphosphorylase [Steroidobacteraceae bacterium]|nr:carboxylating nicotinate-nucleotide diphosphorylase [Steroidobacteraceae bacterium]
MTLEAPNEALARIIDTALAEDLDKRGDVTTTSIVPAGTSMTGVIRSREAGRIAGVDAVRLVLSRLPEPASATIVAADGSDVAAGGTVALLTGSARTLLTGERVILNLLGRLSGVATATAAVVRAVEGTGAAIKDTRKTTPGLRLLEKYAVACGGGVNHRSGLYDAVLIKDNHIGVAGSITVAVARARSSLGERFPIQVEVDTLEQLDEAIACGVTSVLLDNMDPEQLRRAVARVDRGCHVEASGGITLANVRAVAETGVDSISLGWITHSARSLDLGLDVA